MRSVSFFTTDPDPIFRSCKRAFVLTFISLTICLTVLFFLLSAYPFMSSGFEVRQLNLDRTRFNKKQKTQDEEVFTIQVWLRAFTICRNWLVASTCQHVERISSFEVQE